MTLVSDVTQRRVAVIGFVALEPQRVEAVPGDGSRLRAVSVEDAPNQRASRVRLTRNRLRTLEQFKRRALAAALNGNFTSTLVPSKNRVRDDAHLAHHVHPHAAGDDVVHVHRRLGPRVPLARQRQLQVQPALDVHLHVAAVKLARAHPLAVHDERRAFWSHARRVERRDWRVVNNALAHHADVSIRRCPIKRFAQSAREGFLRATVPRRVRRSREQREKRDAVRALFFFFFRISTVLLFRLFRSRDAVAVDRAVQQVEVLEILNRALQQRQRLVDVRRHRDA